MRNQFTKLVTKQALDHDPANILPLYSSLLLQLWSRFSVAIKGPHNEDL